MSHSDGETELLGVNDAGWVVGSVLDDLGLRSFVYDGSTFHDVAFPGAVETAVWGLNNEGVLVGEFLMSEAEQFQAFIAWPVPEPQGRWLLVWGACLGWLTRCRSGRYGR